MTRRILLNGSLVPEAEAVVPVMDRGLLFADAVYEGFGVLDGQIIDYRRHFARLCRSLGELDMAVPFDEADLWRSLMALINVNGVDEGFLYLHVTRGVAERDYVPRPGLTPTVFAFTQGSYGTAADELPPVITMQTALDLRWARRDVKTSNLLGQVLAKQAAQRAGAYEALLIRGEGPQAEVVEGGSSSFFVVIDGVIVTRPLSHDILPGVTRSSVLDVARELGLDLQERVVTLGEAMGADEAFLTASSSYVQAVGAINGTPLAAPGPVTVRLREVYLQHARASFFVPPST